VQGAFAAGGAPQGAHHRTEPHLKPVPERHYSDLSGQRPNGWRFSCGAEVRLSTILNDSAAWPRGGSYHEEPWPQSADSYKRWLGSTAR
jgi:hypothetical protein